MPPAAPAVVGFSGHETFPFRFSWLCKGVRALSEDAGVFTREDAIVVLGVGKNMVRSIRHWCRALDLIQTVGRARWEVTPVGHLLFGNDGADPFLEDVGTLWWLQWMLAKSPEISAAWYFAFNVWPKSDFTRDELAVAMADWVASMGLRSYAHVSLSRDVDCLVRTYLAPRRHWTEESIECPLADLDLISEVGGRLRVNRGRQTNLPDAIFLAALEETVVRLARETRAVPVERVIWGPGSPGRVFALDENEMIHRLERVDALTDGGLAYDATAGVRQILIHRPQDLNPMVVLRGYFESRRRAWVQ